MVAGPDNHQGQIGQPGQGFQENRIALVVGEPSNAEDSKAALAFYSDLFGVETATVSDPMPYNMLRVDGKDVAGVMNMPDEMGSISPHWGVYFASADVDESIERASSLGAKVLFGPMDIPTVGRLATLQDPQGATFTVFKVQA